jgi:hypothetical protein
MQGKRKMENDEKNEEKKRSNVIPTSTLFSQSKLN